MNNRALWKVIFFFSLALTLTTFYQNWRMPVLENSGNPNFLAYIIVTIELLVLIGNYGCAFQRRFFNINVWIGTLIIYPLVLFIEAFIDFNKGGYTYYEFATHLALIFLLTSILLSPIVAYLADFKTKVTPN